MREETLPLSHFESIYARGDDPWRFASSAYEREKYAATLAALPRIRYRSGFEVGCSVGVFTSLLAGRCERLLAVEPVVAALDAARRRNRDHPGVRFAPLFVPRDWPPDCFDLVILSEVLDYLGRDDLAGVAARLRETLLPGGDVVLVHWIGKKRETVAKPTESSEVLIHALDDMFRLTHQERNAHYRLDVLTRVDT